VASPIRAVAFVWVLAFSSAATAAAQTVATTPAAVGSDGVNCSEAYSGQPAKCIRVPCDSKFHAMLGTWKGPFQAYVQELSKNGQAVFRPYESTTTYSEADCLNNLASKETFIIGRVTDAYPAFDGLASKTERSLLIMGANHDGSPFMRTVEPNGKMYTFHLQYENEAASLSIWNLTIPGQGQSPEMEFSTIDGRDFNDNHANTRAVTVTLRVGPPKAPFFQGVIAVGSHSLQK
jgi:hypothetical protein